MAICFILIPFVQIVSLSLSIFCFLEAVEIEHVIFKVDWKSYRKPIANVLNEIMGNRVEKSAASRAVKSNKINRRDATLVNRPSDTDKVTVQLCSHGEKKLETNYAKLSSDAFMCTQCFFQCDRMQLLTAFSQCIDLFMQYHTVFCFWPRVLAFVQKIIHIKEVFAASYSSCCFSSACVWVHTPCVYVCATRFVFSFFLSHTTFKRSARDRSFPPLNFMVLIWTCFLLYISLY